MSICTIKWYKAKYNNLPDKTNALRIGLKDFIASIQSALELDGAVHIIMEPGDATRYEVTLLDLPNHNKLLVSCFVGRSWCRQINRDGYIVPGYLTQGIENVNPFTAAIITDLINMVCGGYGGEHEFYDWQNGSLRMDKITCSECGAVLVKGKCPTCITINGDMSYEA